MLFSEVNVDSFQWTLHGAEDFLPTTMKNHMVKIIIIWSISPDENNNINWTGLYLKCYRRYAPDTIIL